MDPSEWITVKEAAQLIGVTPRTIMRYRQRGLINAHPWPKDHARRFLYARASVVQFAETYLPETAYLDLKIQEWGVWAGGTRLVLYRTWIL